jgi:hypothetical protein
MRRLAVALGLSLIMPAMAGAQSQNFARIEAVAGVPLRVNAHGSAKKSDCSSEALHTIKVIEAPKSGTLTVRKASVKTDKVAGCPYLRIQAQVVFYRARPDLVGSDRFVYEVTRPSGQVQVYDYSVDVKAGPANKPGAGPRDI